MAEEPGVNGTADTIRDPFRRRLLMRYSDQQADNGGEAPGLIANPPEGEGLIGGDDDSSGTDSGGTEFTPTDTGIRESILAQANADFEANLALVQRNAERRRQTRSGVTSQNELREARIAQQARIGALGQFEAGERARQDTILSDQAISERQTETQLTISREQTIANAALQIMIGEQSIAQIRAGGEEERATQEPRLLLERQKETGQISGSTQATMEAVNAEIFRADGSVNLDIVNSIIGAERHTQIAKAFTLENGDFDVEGYNQAVLAAVFTESVRDPNKWQAATGTQDSEVSLGFKRVELEARQVALAERSSLFNEKVVEAGLTGIWEAYGVDELDEFTAAFDSNIDGSGEGTYNSRYDFNDDGEIDFSDYLEFAKAASVGGIETLAMRQLRESTRQFDITTTAGMDQFNAQMDAAVAEGNLTRAQERYITAMALKSNEFVVAEQLDVDRLVSTMELIASEGVDEFTDPEIDSLVAIILDGADVSADALEDFGLDHQRRTLANELHNQFEDYNIDPDSFPEGFMGIQANDMNGWYEVAIRELPNVDPAKRAAWLEIADVDNDGDLTAMDQFFYSILTEA